MTGDTRKKANFDLYMQKMYTITMKSDKEEKDILDAYESGIMKLSTPSKLVLNRG